MPMTTSAWELLLDLSGRRLNAGELLPVIVPGQVHPAGELAACAVTVLQMAVGQPQLGGTGLLVGQRDKLPDMGQIPSVSYQMPPLCNLVYHTTFSRGIQEETYPKAAFSRQKMPPTASGAAWYRR